MLSLVHGSPWTSDAWRTGPPISPLAPALQLKAPEAMRGRVLSLYTCVKYGLFPISFPDRGDRCPLGRVQGTAGGGREHLPALPA